MFEDAKRFIDGYGMLSYPLADENDRNHSSLKFHIRVFFDREQDPSEDEEIFKQLALVQAMERYNGIKCTSAFEPGIPSKSMSHDQWIEAFRGVVKFDEKYVELIRYALRKRYHQYPDLALFVEYPKGRA